MSGLTAHLCYAAGWAAFGFCHSLLARGFVKACLVPRLGPYFRLTYNLFAAVQIAAVVWLGWFLLDGRPAFAYPDSLRLLLGGGHLIGWVLFVFALTGYDLGRLVGITQIRNHLQGISAPEDEPLRRDGFHRYVRHPLYAAAFLILWGTVWNELSLATAIWASLYFLIGTRYEERWLKAHYGAEYEAYAEKVPAFIPWKGRAI
ncbi:MAG: isoprenylcysteine carboxylmethyltransferase family protein [Rhodospirillales bacterium]|nr:isoprenylcysteine carboxylmethyltransferase family protein [Rhodospirillales bacterium]